MTWQADSQLLRDDASGYNLSLGEPFFLYDTMKAHGVYPTNDLGHQQYPKTSPEPELMQQLRGQFPTGHLVVANGAKQAISAALFAYRSVGRKSVQTPAPYWPSYPTLCNMAGASLNAEFVYNVSINTYPNNPDGGMDRFPCDIWDAAYYHPVYFGSRRQVHQPVHTVSIWSAAKLYGCSGARVGWLHTEDEQLASLARRYVEQTTSGVSVGSQRFVARTMRRLAMGHDKAVFEEAKELLQENRRTFEKILEYTSSARYNAGMFAWFEPKDHAKFSKALASSGVKMVTGDACGGKPTFYRMSLGHRVSYLQQAIDALLKELERDAQ